jgi:hypothetical protein
MYLAAQALVHGPADFFIYTVDWCPMASDLLVEQPGVDVLVSLSRALQSQAILPCWPFLSKYQMLCHSRLSGNLPVVMLTHSTTRSEGLTTSTDMITPLLPSVPD